MSNEFSKIESASSGVDETRFVKISVTPVSQLPDCETSQDTINDLSQVGFNLNAVLKFTLS
jgi:hypothetical protein